MRKRILILAVLAAAFTDARGDWLDAVLPPNHVLDKIPWVDANGKPVTGGLFTFEDMNADGRNDVLLAHRAAVPADKMDQPHPQVLTVCYFNPARKVYEKVLDDEGGPLTGVRIVSDAKGSRKFLALEREDWKGGVISLAYTAGAPGRMEKVLETRSPWSYARVDGKDGKAQVFYSSRGKPLHAGQAESVFSWNEASRQFADAKGVPIGKVALLVEPTPTKVVVVLAPTATPAPKVPAQAPPPAVPAKAPASQAAPAPIAVGSAPAANVPGAWWKSPFSAPDVYAVLVGEKVPQRIQKDLLAPLGQEAKAFFAQLNASGIVGTEFSDYRAGYLTAVASELFKLGDVERGKYYLDLVLKYRADYPDALALKAKVSGATP